MTAAKKSQALQPLSNSLVDLLRDGVKKGLWTMEALDRPSPGWLNNTRVDVRFFPDGYQGKQHRNLLRDPQPESPERVQVVSPRDFIPSPDPLPSEPGEELDGITTFTNHPSPEDLPF